GGEGGCLAHRAADPDDVFGGEGALDATPARVGVPDLLQFGGGLRLVAVAKAGGGGLDAHGVLLGRGCSCGGGGAGDAMPVKLCAGYRGGLHPLCVKIPAAPDQFRREDCSNFCSCDRIAAMTLIDETEEADALTIGRRIRQLRTARGITL